jgi:hypothetical protein
VQHGVPLSRNGLGIGGSSFKRGQQNRSDCLPLFDRRTHRRGMVS